MTDDSSTPLAPPHYHQGVEHVNLNVIVMATHGLKTGIPGVVYPDPKLFPQCFKIPIIPSICIWSNCVQEAQFSSTLFGGKDMDLVLAYKLEAKRLVAYTQRLGVGMGVFNGMVSSAK